MNTVATQRQLDDLQVAYSYCLSQLSHLRERHALRLKTRFPAYESWQQLTPEERRAAVKDTLGDDTPDSISTHFDVLIDRALTAIREHEQHGIRVLAIDDDGYPELLKLIQDPPLVLFVKGSLDALSGGSNAAVIGTRNATATGEKVAFKIAKWLAENRWCVVSGLAKGIDTAAHRGTLEAHSPTVAVMATPLNKVYPAENRELADEILQHGGCWVSEYPLWKKPFRSAFVQRDRIQSGMCVAVIPVQTDVEGGTMHTVRFAEQQRRLVLCPRPIQAEQASKQYAGIRALIESHRAQPFSGEEYDRVLECLKERRTELLLKTAQEASSSPLSEIPTVTMLYTPRERSIAEPDPNKATMAEPPTFQGGFGFVEERPKSKRAKTDRKELQRHIALLEQLARELIDARRSDGTLFADIQDVKDWLEQKIRVLRGSTDNP
jgi:DNA protecting protein DprA